jgi:prephenate dehydrogenase
LLGAGYIGGSAVLAARRAGLIGRVVGYDPDPRAIAAALAKGAIDEASASPAGAVQGAGMVLLAAPVRSMPTLLAAIAPALAPEATVIDVGSVKESVVRAAHAVLAGRFVGCHPMAGAEYSGVGAADPSIFAGRVCFLCPPVDASEGALAAAGDFWTGIGCQPVTIDPEVHDRLMAAQSHLPHVAAFALAAALAAELPFLERTTTAASPTTSLRDTTRIAASGPAVWRDILLANARHVAPLMEQMGETLGAMARAVSEGDGERLERILAAGQACRQRLVKE